MVHNSDSRFDKSNRKRNSLQIKIIFFRSQRHDLQGNNLFEFLFRKKSSKIFMEFRRFRYLYIEAFENGERIGIKTKVGSIHYSESSF